MCPFDGNNGQRAASSVCWAFSDVRSPVTAAADVRFLYTYRKPRPYCHPPSCKNCCCTDVWHCTAGRFEYIIMETLRASLEAIESITTRAGGGERQAVAAAGAALVLAVAMYVLSGNKRQAAHREEHWDAVCQQALQRRDGMQHKVLQGSGGNIDEVCVCVCVRKRTAVARCRCPRCRTWVSLECLVSYHTRCSPSCMKSFLFFYECRQK